MLHLVKLLPSGDDYVAVLRGRNGQPFTLPVSRADLLHPDKFVSVVRSHTGRRFWPAAPDPATWYGYLHFTFGVPLTSEKGRHDDVRE